MLSLACLGMLAAANIATSAPAAGKLASTNAELSSSAAAPVAARGAAPDAVSPALSPQDAGGIVDTVRHNRYELQRVNMSSPRSRPDSELAGKILQVQSLELATKPAPETSSAKASIATAGPAATGSASLEIDAQTLEKLRQLPTCPAKAVAIADSLFGGRRYDSAFAFYEMALKSSPEGDTNAWILFQMGNCRRHSDPAAAREYYKRVLAEAPDSPWAKAAAAQDKLVQWDQANSPRSLLDNASSTKPAALAARPAQAGTSAPAAPSGANKTAP
jgi:tetratricopeptide (TPR) repeat protein